MIIHIKVTLSGKTWKKNLFLYSSLGSWISWNTGETAKGIPTVLWELVNRHGLVILMKIHFTILMIQIQNAESRYLHIFISISYSKQYLTLVTASLTESQGNFFLVCFRTHLLVWQIWEQRVMSTHFFKYGSTTWKCVGAYTSVKATENATLKMNLVWSGTL